MMSLKDSGSLEQGSSTKPSEMSPVEDKRGTLCEGKRATNGERRPQTEEES